MLMYGWMKFVEMAPERYDWAVKLMTAGRLDQLKDRISQMIGPGDRVLDVGCGTGTLALRCLKRGAVVTGLDISSYMLEVARKKADSNGLGQNLTLIKDSVTQLRKHVPAESLDSIVCTMVLGEFSAEYLDYIVQECFRLLRPGGRLIIADEVWPENRVARMIYRVVLGVSWIPQFLLLRRVNYPVSNLAQRVTGAGFAVTQSETSFFTSFCLITATKPNRANAQYPCFSVPAQV